MDLKDIILASHFAGGTGGGGGVLSNYYTKAQSNSRFALKGDSYTKSESDDKYALKDDLNVLQKTALTATVTIAVADWEGGTTATKNVTGVTASNIVFCDSSDADVQCTAQGAGTLTFTASATPSAEVTVKVVILP